MIKKCLTCLWVLFCPVFFLAQIDAAFLDHLSRQDLKTEHRAYLDQFTAANDSLHYFEAKYHLQYGNDSLFLENFKKAGRLAAEDSSLINSASVIFITSKNTAARNSWFSSLPDRLSPAAAQLRIFFLASSNPKAYDGNNFPPQIKSSFLAYRKVSAKKPVIAGALSALLPGAGKLYAGKSRSALFAFLMHAGYAAQTVESYRKLGPSHPFTIINAGIFSVFYLANIYGSYKSISDLRKETKKQFLYDAAHYY